MRVATFNLLHGLSLVDGRIDPDRLRAAVRTIDADVLGLQEVDRDQPRGGGLDLTAIAAEAMGAVDHRFAAALVGTPGGRFLPATRADDGTGEPQFGVALLSRWPVRRWFVRRLAAAPVRSPVLAGMQLRLLPDEPRVVLAAVIDTPGGPCTIANTHLSFVPGWNARQLRTVLAALADLPAPRILVGDLNLPARVVRITTRWRSAAVRPTYPNGGPRIQLDHVLLEPWSDLVVDGAGTPEVPLSDHRPLVVALHP